MSWWVEFVKLLKTQEPTPTFSSPIYWISIIVVVVLSTTFVLLNYFKKFGEKAYKYTLLGIWITMLVLEIFKQIMYSYDIEGSTIVPSYTLFAFPFQICSIAMYFLPVLIFAKDGMIKQRFELFYSLCFIIAAIFALATPAFYVYVYGNFHTEAYHILLFVSALLVGLKRRNTYKIDILWQAFIIFLCLLTIAIILNAIINPFMSGYNRINLFFVNWINPPGVPVLDQIWKSTPYPVYLLCYIIFFAAGGIIGYMLLSLILNRKIDFIEMAKAKKKANKKKH